MNENVEMISCNNIVYSKVTFNKYLMYSMSYRYIAMLEKRSSSSTCPYEFQNTDPEEEKLSHGESLPNHSLNWREHFFRTQIISFGLIP